MGKSEMYAVLGLISSILFVIIMLNLDSFASIDNPISFSNTLLVKFSDAVRYLFEPFYVIIYAFAISLMLFLRKMKKDALFLTLLGIIGGGLVYTIKEIVHRARPVGMLVAESGYSFPSGHAVMAVLFFGFLAYLQNKRIKSKKMKLAYLSASIFCILLIGFSRIVLGVHYISDVLGGFLLGLFILFSGLAVSVKKD